MAGGKLLTTVEVAERLNVTAKTVGEWCRRGLLKAVKERGNWIIDEEELEEWVHAGMPTKPEEVWRPRR